MPTALAKFTCYYVNCQGDEKFTEKVNRESIHVLRVPLCCSVLWLGAIYKVYFACHSESLAPAKSKLPKEQYDDEDFLIRLTSADGR